jgi:tellurite resistance protein
MTEPNDHAEQREATRKRLKRAAIELQARRDIATGLLTDDMTLAQRAQALGFTETTARVFDLLPVIHIAWADGEVQASERDAIMGVLQARGLEPGSDSYLLISALLERHPGQAYLDETLAVLHELVANNETRAAALVDLCFAVAEAHGSGPQGLDDPIDANERHALFTVAEALGERATAWIRNRFDRREG